MDPRGDKNSGWIIFILSFSCSVFVSGREQQCKRMQAEKANVDGPKFTEESPALTFHIHRQLKHARASTVYLPHGKVDTPVFMPVGTKGTLKGLSSHQLINEEAADLAPEIILSNTYHLALQPGTELLAELGGLHQFMNWPRNLLTDSGGFQMVSLLKLAVIKEEGVTFKSPIDGTEMLLTPEQSIKCQNEIGADIMMQLDDVVSSMSSDDERFKEATFRSGDLTNTTSHTLLIYPIMHTLMHIPSDPPSNASSSGDLTNTTSHTLLIYPIMHTLMHIPSDPPSNASSFTPLSFRVVRWLDRCIAAHQRPKEQNLFAIVQGGLDISPGGLREQCMQEMVKRNLPGYAIGGLAGGEDKDTFWRVVAHGTAGLPLDRPRYVMGRTSVESGDVCSHLPYFYPLSTDNTPSVMQQVCDGGGWVTL